jgi:hypothetical protein
MGSADIILDLVSTGVTLRENNLKQLEGGMIMESQGALVANRRALLERPVSLGGGGGDGGAGLVGGPELVLLGPATRFMLLQVGDAALPAGMPLTSLPAPCWPLHPSFLAAGPAGDLPRAD